MITSIKLKNFKQHQNLQLDFVQALNVIQGDNGAGKTTIIKAILFALFGASAAGTKSHLGTWGIGNPEVVLNLSLRGVAHTVTRTLNKATIHKGSELMASGQTPVTKYIEDTLGLQGKTLRTLLCAEQGETQELLNMGAAGLQAKLEAVSKLTTIDEVLRLVSNSVTSLSGMIEGIGQVMNQNEITNLESEEVLKSKSLADVEYNRTATVAAHEAVSRTLENLNTQISLLRSKKSQYDRLVGEMESFNVLHESGFAAYSKAKDTMPTAFDFGLLDENVGRLDAEYQDLSLHVKEATRQEVLASEYGRNLSNSKTELAKLNEQASQIKEAKETLDLIDSAQKLITALKGEWVKIGKEISTKECPTCHKAYDETDVAALHRELENVRTDLVASQEAEVELQEKFRSYGFQKTYVLDHEHAVTMVTNRIATLESNPVTFPGFDFDKAKARQEEIQADLRLLATKAGELRSTKKACEATIADWLDKQRYRNEVEEKLATFNLTEMANIDNMETKTKELTANLNDLRDKGSRFNEEKAALTSRLDTLRHILQIEKVKVERVEQLEADLRVRNKLIKFLRDNRTKLAQAAWDSLVNYASYLIGVTTEGFMNTLSREGGEFYINEGEMNVPVEELSGARKSIVGLSLRIALSKVFYGDNGFVLLDEATADCTEENSARVAGMLQGLNSQVIMVSHRQGDAVNATNVIKL